MARPSESTGVERDPRSGAFAERSTMGGKFMTMGTAADGAVIIAPTLKPKNFSVRQIRKAVRALKQQERRSQAAATAS